MARQAVLPSREGQLAALTEDGWRPRTVVIRGPAGSGRSALLDQGVRRLTADGAGDGTVLRLELAGEGAEPAPDGVSALLRAVRERYEELAVHPDLGPALASVRRRHAEVATSPARRAALFHELTRLFACLGGGDPALVVIDDADTAAGCPPLLLAARTAGHVVLCSVTAGSHVDGVDDNAQELVERADQVVDLHGSLPDHEVSALVKAVARVRPDPALCTALRIGLGPWWGNPAAVVAAVEHMTRRGALVTVGRCLALSGPDAVVGLPAEHPAVGAAVEAGPAATELVALAASPPRLALDDLSAVATATGHPEPACGATVDRLVARGVLEHDGEAFAVRTPAVGVAVRELLDEETVCRLHAACARHLEPEPGRPVSTGSVSRLADHVVAAGPQGPRRAGLAALLQEEAIRVRCPEPGRAAARLWAARRHVETAAEADDLAADAMRLLVEAGEHARLAEVVAELVRDGATAGVADRLDLPATAAVAAWSTGRPVPADVHAALAEPARTACPLRVCARWFAGERPLLTELEACLAGVTRRWTSAPTASLGEHRARRQRGGVDIGTELERRDVLPVLESLLEPFYRCPTEGAAAWMHEFHQARVQGRWDDALAAARMLTATPAADPVGREIAGLLAAEICSLRGDDAAASGWLDEVGPTPRDPVLRAWVRCGVLHRRGDPDAAFRHGREAYPATTTDNALAWRLLLRLALAADELGEPERRWTIEAVRRRRADTPASRGTALGLLAEGLLTGDVESARRGEAAVRSQGSRDDLLVACLVVGARAADPEPWLREARALAREVGDPVLRARLKRVSEERGRVVPPPSAPQGALSAGEQRIVDLVRQGATNREIGASIRMSEKTVENHLTRIYAKVGCRTRHGLVAATLDGRLPGAPTAEGA